MYPFMYHSAGGATRTVCLACILLLAAALPAAAAGEDDAGRYVVHWFNGDGVEVSFDGGFRGTIADTELAVAVDPAAPPAREYTIRDGERLMYTGFIERAPAAGETIDLFPQFCQVEQPIPGAEVNETGWYLIYGADGEDVYIDNAFAGVVEGGTLRVAVNTTLPPPEEFVFRDKERGTMSRHQFPPLPPPGGTVHVYTRVQPAPYASSLPAETSPTPLPGFGAAGAIAGLLVAARSLRQR
ncbi:hypothetical protein Memar_1345 [Methanoculleus marisnigri JR1]|uniref:Uncharacterized protein n=2 Tax=Methanoculleus TaxID=45989 RepID=A3CV75_METMJ|nr:hypothetical protein Memar_1345 [Methanoculleus marisnigri JR1]